LWVTVKVAVATPPGTLIELGSVTSFVFELERITVAPAGGVTPVKVTVPETDV
jgi:hypothetical protein